MPKKQFGTAAVDVDGEGFLTDFSQWTREVAAAIAKEEGLAELTPAHWKVLELDLDSGPLRDALHQEATIFCLPHGTGSDGTDLLHIVRIRHFVEAHERIQRRLHAGLADISFCKSILSQPHGDAHVFDHFHFVLIRTDTSHRHTDRVGADIDRRDCLHS